MGPRSKQHLPRRYPYRSGFARVDRWRGRPDVAAIELRAEGAPPSSAIDEILAALRAEGFRGAVTGAITPAQGLPLVDAGFAVTQRLHLLEHDLADLPALSVPLRRGRRADRRAVLDIDARAFAAFWRLDHQGLDRALGATPATRFRVSGSRGAVVGYAIVGRAARQGYVQRLAVDPAARGQGRARTLLADGLAWLGRHRVGRALVNTPEGNEPALALYRSCGFRVLPVGLWVLGRTL